MITVELPSLAAILYLTGSASLCGTNGLPHPVPPVAVAANHEDLYEGGVPFGEFLDAAEQRRDTWHANYREGTVPADVLERARAIGGTWRILAVAEDWCGDSAHTIPYIARLVEAVDGLEMRVVNSTVGRNVMEAHRTPDGRASTPTVLLLNEDFEEVGCFIERPSSLQSWFLENESKLEEDDLHDQKYAWYDEDRGAQTVAEVVEIMESAARGAPVCKSGG